MLISWQSPDISALNCIAHSLTVAHFSYSLENKMDVGACVCVCFDKMKSNEQ